MLLKKVFLLNVHNYYDDFGSIEVYCIHCIAILIRGSLKIKIFRVLFWNGVTKKYSLQVHF